MATPPLLKVVPVVSRVPVTTICPWPPPKPLPGYDTMSPEANLSVPSSLSVSPAGIVTATPAPTASVPSVPTVKPLGKE